MRSGSVVVMSTVRKADPYLGFAEVAIYSEISVRAPGRRRTEGCVCGQQCSQCAWESSCLQRRQT